MNNSSFLEISLLFIQLRGNSVYIPSKRLGISNEDQMFSRNIFTSLFFKSGTSAHAQLGITLLYILICKVLVR